MFPLHSSTTLRLGWSNKNQVDANFCAPEGWTQFALCIFVTTALLYRCNCVGRQSMCHWRRINLSADAIFRCVRIGYCAAERTKTLMLSSSTEPHKLQRYEEEREEMDGKRERDRQTERSFACNAIRAVIIMHNNTGSRSRTLQWCLFELLLSVAYATSHIRER